MRLLLVLIFGLISCNLFGEDGGTADAGPYVGGAVFVDGVVGDDTNLGTADSPVATIAKGIEIAGDIQYARHMVQVFVSHAKYSSSLDYNESIIVEDSDLVRLEIISPGGNAGGMAATGFGLTTVLGFRSESDNENLKYLKLKGFKFTSGVSFDADADATQFIIEGAQIDNCLVDGTLEVSRLSRFRVDDSIIYGATTVTNTRVFELIRTRAQQHSGVYAPFDIVVDGNKSYPSSFGSSLFRVKQSWAGSISTSSINGAAYEPQVEINNMNSMVSGEADLDSDFVQYPGTMVYFYPGSAMASGNSYQYWGGLVNKGGISISGSVVHYSTYYPEWWGSGEDKGACTTDEGLRGECTMSMDSTGDCGCSL